MKPTSPPKLLTATLLTTFLFEALTAQSWGMGPKRPTEEEIHQAEQARQEADRRTQAEAELKAKQAKVLELSSQIRSIEWGQIRDFETRCRKAQELTGDSVENVAAQINGRYDWSMKCTEERLTKALNSISEDFKNLEAKKVAASGAALSPAEEERYMQELMSEPAIEFRHLYQTQLKFMTEYRKRGGAHGLPLYPVWAVPGSNADQFYLPSQYAGWVAPKDSATGCDDIPNYQGPRAIDFFNPVVFCEAGCFENNQRILAQKETLPASSMRKGMSITRLEADSTLDRLLFGTGSIQAVTQSTGDETEEMVELTTLSGKHLRVTTHHPVMKADGVMHPAAHFKQGDLVLTMNSNSSVTPDPIVDVRGYTARTQVYNYRLNSNHIKENVIVAEGFLVGTSLYQNELRDQMNRGMMRVLLPSTLLSQ